MGLRDLFRPKTEHSDPAVRAQAVASLTDRDQLMIATLDRDETVWRAAIDRLAAIAREDGDLKRLQALAGMPHRWEDGSANLQACHAAAILRSWQKEAIAGIRDAETLARVATTAADGEVRAAAVARITDEAELASIARQTGNPDIIDRIWNPQLIRDLALSKGSVQRAAIARLDDQQVLNQIAGDRKQDSWAREAAIERLQDEEALAQLVIANAPEARLALARIRDPKLLGRLALDAPNADRRRDAIGRTCDVDALLEIVLDEQGSWDHSGLASAALDRLRDLKADREIEQAARSAPAAGRRAAVRAIKSNTLLFEIAAGDRDHEVRVAAAERLSDPALLRRLLDAKGPEGGVARSRLESDAMTVEEALRGQSADIRIAAIARLRSLEALNEIIETSREPELKAAAEKRRPAVAAWKSAQAELARRIDALKFHPDYRLELEIRAKEDSEGYSTPVYDEVVSLEAELRLQTKTGPTASG